MRRLSLHTRMVVGQVVTLLAMLVAAWFGGQWLIDTLPWWAAYPLALGYGWCLGWFTMSKVMPRIYRWIMLRWIDEQPESVRYLLRLRFYFEIEEKE